MVVEDLEFYTYGKEWLTTRHAGQPSTSTPTRTVGGLRQSGGEQTPNQEIQPDKSQATNYSTTNAMAKLHTALAQP